MRQGRGFGYSTMGTVVRHPKGTPSPSPWRVSQTPKPQNQNVFREKLSYMV